MDFRILIRLRDHGLLSAAVLLGVAIACAVGCTVPVASQEAFDKYAALHDVLEGDADDAGSDAAVGDVAADTVDTADTADTLPEVDAPDADAAHADVADAAPDVPDVDAGPDVADAAMDVDAAGDATATVDADAGPVDTGVDPCATLTCDDTNPCTADSCVNGACEHTPTTGACNDGDVCTTGDACSGGKCKSGAKISCDDGNICTDDVCSKTIGCGHTNNQVACSDNNPCTGSDTCGSGACSGTAVSCDDGSPCTTDSCGATGCAHVSLPDWTTCTEGFICAAGKCGDVKTSQGMAFIPGGSFWMGCSSKYTTCAADEQPQHAVVLSAYYMDLNETTVAQYKTCVDAGGCTAPATQAGQQPYATYPTLTDRPVNFVTVAQAQAYCKWRGGSFDLPTEAQWEMAALGSCGQNGSVPPDPSCPSKMRLFPWGDTPPTCANAWLAGKSKPGCDTDSLGAVGTKPAGDSPYGIHDLIGNVREWTRDDYRADYYAASPQNDPIDAVAPWITERHGRGWSFDSAAALVSTIDRGASAGPTTASEVYGFRCVRAEPVADLCAGVTCTTDGACGTGAACNPANGQCVSTTSAACDDGLSCTTSDSCAGGACVGMVGSLCDDANPCTTDACAASGCTHAPGLDGPGCDDGNACTTTDACSGGICKGGPPVSCDDANPCTADSCDPAKGCTHSPASSGIACIGGACGGDGLCIASPVGMAFIPGDTFWMGCNGKKDFTCNTNEVPQHAVTLSAFYMDLTETTVAQYKACVDAGVCTVPSTQTPTPYATYPDFAQNPVNFVSWAQAQQYCQWRGVGYDLPTEAQWEMAARGSCAKNGSSAGDAGCYAAMRPFPWGEAKPTCSYAVMNSTSYGCGTNVTAVVGSIPAGDSPYGLHDLAGNVWEWNRDWYSATYYASSPAIDPYNNTSDTERVVRGGSFFDPANSERSGFRSHVDPTTNNGGIGLRCVKAYAPPPTCDDGNPCTADSVNADGSCAHGISTDGKPCQGDGLCAGGICTCVHGATSTQINDDGTLRTVCVPEYPIWGNRPVSPQGYYTDNGNGTVSDRQTLLTWQQNPPGVDLDFASAQGYCDALVLGGKADWRLPTLPELESTVDYAAAGPATDASKFHDAVHVFWSSTVHGIADDWGAAGLHWAAGIGTSGVLSVQSTPQRARCVRGGDGFLPLVARYDIKTPPSGVAKDNVLGVSWEVNSQGYGSHGSAEPYCNGVQTGGFSGWRMPNIRELTWLDDRSQPNPQYDPIAFPQNNGSGYWSSTPVAGTANYWGIGFNTGGYFNLPDGPTDPIRCVSDALCVGGCDDGNDCTTDSCSGGCVHTPVSDGASCQIGGVCAAGACTCSVNTTPTTINDNGKLRSLCVYEYPAWGNRSVTPTGVYTSNGDGTVSDSQTHLMWQRDQNGVEVDLPTARAYCDALILGGKTDWRMPTLAELDSLTDYARVSPPVDPTYFTSVSGGFWTATGHPVGTDGAPGSVWIIGGDGATDAGFWPGTGPARVRCVRSGDGIAPITKRFSAAYVAGGSVWDNVLKVEWADDFSTYYTPASAASYCAGSSLLGKSGWRLPTAREIIWLADRSHAPPLDLTVFGYLYNIDCYSSTPSAVDPSKFWFCAFGNDPSNPNKSYLGYTGYTDAGEAVRCVRNGP